MVQHCWTIKDTAFESANCRPFCPGLDTRPVVYTYGTDSSHPYMQRNVPGHCGHSDMSSMLRGADAGFMHDLSLNQLTEHSECSKFTWQRWSDITGLDVSLSLALSVPQITWSVGPTSARWVRRQPSPPGHAWPWLNDNPCPLRWRGHDVLSWTCWTQILSKWYGTS